MPLDNSQSGNQASEKQSIFTFYKDKKSSGHQHTSLISGFGKTLQASHVSFDPAKALRQDVFEHDQLVYECPNYQQVSSKKTSSGKTSNQVTSSSSRSATSYSWAVLGLMFLIRVSFQWQRYILSYAFAFVGLGEKKGDPYFELQSYFPEIQESFGVLSGLAYLLPYALFGLYFGKISD